MRIQVGVPARRFAALIVRKWRSRRRCGRLSGCEHFADLVQGAVLAVRQRAEVRGHVLVLLACVGDQLLLGGRKRDGLEHDLQLRCAL
jgi:hypothetical protein